MFEKFRIKLADRLLSWAMSVHFEVVLDFVITSYAEIERTRPPKKIGRPLGSKDKGPRKVTPGVKIGRPVGVKDGQGRKARA